MNSYEVPIDPNRLCFYCPNPAVIEYRKPLTDKFAEGVDWLDIAKGEAQPIRGPIVIAAPACADHRDALWVAMGEPSWGKRLTKITCPDRWHFDDDAYEDSLTDLEHAFGDWVASHYECPTCGFATMSSSEIAPGVEGSPAYLFAKEALP